MRVQVNENDDDDDVNDPLDETLRRHIAAELDGQLGRARAAFERNVTRVAQAPVRPRPRRRVSGARVWIIGTAGAGAALAASIAAVWGVPLFMKPVTTKTTSVTPVQPTLSPSSRPGGTSIANAAGGRDWQPARQGKSRAPLH